MKENFEININSNIIKQIKDDIYFCNIEKINNFEIIASLCSKENKLKRIYHMQILSVIQNKDLYKLLITYKDSYPSLIKFKEENDKV